MFGYEQAAQEYESKMTAPYDRGGALYDYDEEEKERLEYLEREANNRVDEILLQRDNQ